MLSNSTDDNETARYLASYIAEYFGGTIDIDKLYELIKEFYDTLK